LNNRITLLGDVVAIEFMPAFDLFCLSSRYEGMPYVYLESLAAGLPIVSTRVGGVSMCVEEGRNGLIVAPDDPQALATALKSVVDNPELRARFAAASTEIAERFTAAKMVEQTLDVYGHVLAAAQHR